MRQLSSFFLSKTIVFGFLFILVSINSGCIQQKMIQTDLYFGLSNADGPISTDQWDSFKTATIDKYFDGYTEVDCKGFWKNDAGVSLNESTKLIIFIHNKSSDEFEKIDSVISLYKTQFDQESVLQVNKKISAEFK
jgi:hypothetical protein